MSIKDKEKLRSWRSSNKTSFSKKNKGYKMKQIGKKKTLTMKIGTFSLDTPTKN